ncbi:MAG: trypsin-like peptidase domain-containing protein [Sandaracinaceae bacterium]|nr:trypsin-like peptidase domain-containing protein [Sandaracinaceae bacterium]
MKRLVGLNLAVSSLALAASVAAIALHFADGGAEPEPEAAAPAPEPPAEPSPPLELADGPARTADVAARALPSVVNISSTRMVRDAAAGNPFFDVFRQFFGLGEPQPHEAQSLGSGVIVSEDGVVLTNHHVVADATEIRVILSDGRELPARIAGSDPESDVAVLRLEGEGLTLTPLPYGDSSRLRQGELVLAIGNPFGVGQTVTMGIVSATGRASMGITDYEDFIQTDAAINPGNSGGALVNLRGELVGINTAILSRTGGNHGIGFAIPSNMARPIAEALLREGT